MVLSVLTHPRRLAASGACSSRLFTPALLYLYMTESVDGLRCASPVKQDAENCQPSALPVVQTNSSLVTATASAVRTVTQQPAQKEDYGWGKICLAPWYIRCHPSTVQLVFS